MHGLLIFDDNKTENEVVFIHFGIMCTHIKYCSTYIVRILFAICVTMKQVQFLGTLKLIRTSLGIFGNFVEASNWLIPGKWKSLHLL